MPEGYLPWVLPLKGMHIPCADDASDGAWAAAGHHNRAHRHRGPVQVHRGDLHAHCDLQDRLLLLLPPRRLRPAGGRDHLPGSLCSGQGHLHRDGPVLPGMATFTHTLHPGLWHGSIFTSEPGCTLPAAAVLQALLMYSLWCEIRFSTARSDSTKL